ncbi:roadblock/LC7 domain-containing protein [Nocardia jiangxiensis]|uniref:Roadblock/LC7 domain-containing protein n=1 Tax=Nocardia jiangxiensis TaxID=282685 RepID=A0ABW6RU37_9NOCA
MTTSAHAGDLGWLLDDLAERLTGVRFAVVHSTDGLSLGHTQGMSREDAEHLAALSAALYGLACTAGARFEGGGVRQAVIELDQAVLFVTAAGRNTCLALQADQDANFGMVAYEMNLTVQRIGGLMSTDTRNM